LPSPCRIAITAAWVLPDAMPGMADPILRDRLIEDMQEAVMRYLPPRHGGEWH
jgi:hypothetical protein